MEIRGPILLPARREDIELSTLDGLTLVGELALPLGEPAATLVTLLTVGLRMGIGPFFLPMTVDLGYSRSLLAGIVAIGMHRVEIAFCSPIRISKSETSIGSFG